MFTFHPSSCIHFKTSSYFCFILPSTATHLTFETASSFLPDTQPAVLLEGLQFVDERVVGYPGKERSLLAVIEYLMFILAKVFSLGRPDCGRSVPFCPWL